MKSQVLHTVWCHISCEAAGEFWHWSLSGVKGLIVSDGAYRGCKYVFSSSTVVVTTLAAWQRRLSQARLVTPRPQLKTHNQWCIGSRDAAAEHVGHLSWGAQYLLGFLSLVVVVFIFIESLQSTKTDQNFDPVIILIRNGVFWLEKNDEWMNK